MNIRSHIRGQNRAFDYLYDPSFIISGSHDIWKLNSFTLMKYAPVQVLVNYDVMFADIPQQYRQIICQKNEISSNYHHEMYNKTLPTLNDRFIQIIDKYQQQYDNKFEIDIKGKHRANFFYYTKINISMPTLKLDLKDDEIQNKTSLQRRKKSVGIQTIYRESSAQTRPYLPNAILNAECINDKELEIIRVADLLEDAEQPGKFEIKAIERLRRKREWEKDLSNISSTDDIEKKRIILEELEWEEWLSREEQIQEIQNMRFEIVKNLMKKREMKFKDVSKVKLENSMKRIETESLLALEKIDHEYNRNLRMLEKKYKRIKEKKNNYDIISTKSILEKQNLFKRKYNKHLSLNQIDQIIEENKVLEHSFKPWEISDLSNPKEPVKEIRKGFMSEKNLKELYDSLQKMQQPLEKKQQISKFSTQNKLDKILDNKEIGVEEDRDAESTYQCIIYLQKIIKGRAIQNMIYEKMGKLRNHIFSQENDEKQEILSQPFEKSQKSQKAGKNMLDTLFNFLNKELKRLQEERKAHALYMLAEHERFKRESIELEKRQEENRRHQEHDEIYRNIAKSTQDTVTMFLENILIEETNLKATKDAQQEIQNLAKQIDLQANNVEEFKIKNEEQNVAIFSDNEKTIFDITDNFLFPEILKRLAHKSMKNKQLRHLRAAHHELYKQIDNAFHHKDSDDDSTWY